MIPFKDLVSDDRADVFLNFADFAEIHLIDDHAIRCVLDADAYVPKLTYEGISSAGIRLFIRKEDIDFRRAPGASLDVDGDIYQVDYWNDDMGLYTVGLTSFQG